MVTPVCSFGYAAGRSSVPLPNGRPSVSGLVSAVAITSPTTSGPSVAGRPARGRSGNPSGPSALNRLSQVRTTSARTPSRRPTAGARSPWCRDRIMRARSTTRAGSVRDATRRRSSSPSSAVTGRTRRAILASDILPIQMLRPCSAPSTGQQDASLGGWTTKWSHSSFWDGSSS